MATTVDPNYHYSELCFIVARNSARDHAIDMIAVHWTELQTQLAYKSSRDSRDEINWITVHRATFTTAHYTEPDLHSANHQFNEITEYTGTFEFVVKLLLQPTVSVACH